MPEVQKHGFDFEKKILSILNVEKEVYNSKYGINCPCPISIKYVGHTNSIGFGSVPRFWTIQPPLNLIVGRWYQEGAFKKIISIDEYILNLERLNIMKGAILAEEICEFDNKLKIFSGGKDGQILAQVYAEKWKAEHKDRFGVLNIAPKIDSKNQRRVQCDLSYNKLIKLFGNISMKPIFRGVEFIEMFKSEQRKFNKR